MAFVKPHPIRDLESKDAAQDIDANFDAIWNALRQLRGSIKDLDEPVAGVIGRDGVPGPPGDSGAPGEDGAPGPAGPAGADGATGAAGPATLGPMGIDGTDGEDGWPVPGPIGPTGATGATGAAGDQAIGFVLDGEPGEDGFMMLGQSGGGSSAVGWTLAASQVAAGAAQYDFANLSAYSEILIVTQALTKSANGLTAVVVSTDNGSSFLTTSGDYISLANTGVGTNQTSMTIHITTASAARTAGLVIQAFNNGSGPKWANCSTASTLFQHIIPTTTALNAVRVFSSSGSNLTGGTIYIYGRT